MLAELCGFHGLCSVHFQALVMICSYALGLSFVVQSVHRVDAVIRRK